MRTGAWREFSSGGGIFQAHVFKGSVQNIEFTIPESVVEGTPHPKKLKVYFYAWQLVKAEGGGGPLLFTTDHIENELFRLGSVWPVRLRDGAGEHVHPPGWPAPPAAARLPGQLAGHWSRLQVSKAVTTRGGPSGHFVTLCNFCHAYTDWFILQRCDFVYQRTRLGIYFIQRVSNNQIAGL